MPRAKPSEARDERTLRVAFLAFNKHAASDARSRIANPPTFTGSDEQLAIWDAVASRTEHIIVEAVAGSGKTATAAALCGRINATVDTMTYHSFGYKACRSAGIGTGEPRFKLAQEIAEKLLKGDKSKRKWRRPTRAGDSFDYNTWRVAQLTSKLAEYARMNLIDWKQDEDDLYEALEKIADHYNMQPSWHLSQAFELLPRVLDELAKSRDLDFPSMIWRPVVNDLPFPKYDLLICDELQDTSPDQAEMLMRAVGEGRFMGIGDTKQALYSFRGADVHAMRKIIERLEKTERGVLLLPLTATRRCPRRVVSLAQRIVSQIRALESAPAGEVRDVTYDGALRAMSPGDMVLCRVNKELVAPAYDLLKRGVKAVIRGRDVGKSLVGLIDKLKGVTLEEFSHNLSEYWSRESAKLRALGDKGENRLVFLEDQCGCLMELMQGMKTLPEMKARIETLFADFDEDGKPKAAVVLSTVHRAKGLEADRVWILRPDLIPHPMAKKAHEKESEMCVAYVAVTRAKSVLCFVGGRPEVFR
jgi:DNA helicase-2/ATP-dependent DNA helicase PcrA